MYVCARARTSNPVTADLQSAVNECHLYFTAVLNLNTVFFYSFCSFSFMYFLYRQNQRSAPERAKAKVPKSSAQSKNSRNVLHNVDNTALSHPVRCKLRLHCARLYAGGIVDLQANSCHVVSTQPNIACRLSLFVSVQALRDLCGIALLKNITLPHFKHILAYS